MKWHLSVGLLAHQMLAALAQDNTPPGLRKPIMNPKVRFIDKECFGPQVSWILIHNTY